MIENPDSLIIFHFFGLPINATLFYSWITMFFLCLLAYLTTKNLSSGQNVSRLQAALEMVILAVREQIKDVSRDNPAKYLPIIGTFFLFIFTSNLLTIIPWFRAPTASYSTTGAFTLCVFCFMPYFGIKNAGLKGYLKKYLKPSPFMLPMNILSDLTAMFSLSFRLYGNVLSGAVIGSVMIMLAPFLLPLPMQMLGLLTGTIQAYIFALLAIVYISSVPSGEIFTDDNLNIKL